MITIKDLNKGYGDIKVLKNINITFPNTGLICILGESGCGKTTLLNLISGLDSEYSGDIVVDKVSLKTLKNSDLCNYRKDYIGFIFQDYKLMNHYTVIENVLYPSILKSVLKNDKVKEANKILEDMGIKDKEKERVENLSGGQKQRVAIARALIKDPKIILADEPTGALDRGNSCEVMDILKEISKTKLVIIITHDHHICEYADEIITIENETIQQRNIEPTKKEEKKEMVLTPPIKVNCINLASKNFKMHRKRYILVSFIYAIGVLCMILSFSSSNIMKGSIEEFKNKNVSFNNGYIKNDGKDIYQKLSQDRKLENVYKQYKLENIELSLGEFSKVMKEKYPMPKTSETMSYGTMPHKEKQEIAITPSLAKQIDSQTNSLIGKELVVKHGGNIYQLKISGIYNAGYDDFFVSSNIEQDMYKGVDKEKYYSISYDVKNFNDIISISESLHKKGIKSENAMEQVKVMQTSFNKIKMLFNFVSLMILFASIFIVVIILVKLQSTRYRMVGILYSFGFQRNSVSKFVKNENRILTLLATSFTSVLMIILILIDKIYQLNLRFKTGECVIILIISSIVMLAINAIISRKLMNTKPHISLRK